MSKKVNIIIYSVIFLLVFSAAFYFKSQQSNDMQHSATKPSVSQDSQPATSVEKQQNNLNDETISSENRLPDNLNMQKHEVNEEIEKINENENFTLSNDQAGYMQYMQSQSNSATTDSSSESASDNSNNIDPNSNPLVDNTTPGRRFGTISEGTVESKNINKYYPDRSNKINPWALQEFYGTPANLPTNQPASQEFDERKDRLQNSIQKLRQQAGQ